MKLINSFHSLNRFVKNLVFKASLWSFEVNQFISSTESVCEKIEVFDQAISAVKIFSLKQALWSFEVNQFISSTESVCEKIEVFDQAISAVKIFSFSKWLHRRNWFSIFFHANYASFKKIEKNQISYILNHFAKK